MHCANAKAGSDNLKIEFFCSAKKDFPEGLAVSIQELKENMEKVVRKRLELREKDEVVIWVEK